MHRHFSDLWTSLSASLFANIDDEFIRSFREPGRANNRLAAWDPLDPTMRYYKLMLYRAAERQPEYFFDAYRKLGNVDIGNPVSVQIRSCSINVDYLFSIEEVLFLEETINLAGLHSVVEVGAGFGRTCHAILRLAPNVGRYTIVDLPNVLELSRRVLSRVIPDQLDKIHFVDATSNISWRGISADLALNIDSFQEMRPTIIDEYMSGLVSNCRYFYTKNPIAKYRPESIGIKRAEPERLFDVFELGYCRDVIDIFDDHSIDEARAKYLEAYRPSSEWRLLAHRPLDLFHYLHHALYERTR